MAGVLWRVSAGQCGRLSPPLPLNGKHLWPRHEDHLLSLFGRSVQPLKRRLTRHTKSISFAYPNEGMTVRMDATSTAEWRQRPWFRSSQLIFRPTLC